MKINYFTKNVSNLIAETKKLFGDTLTPNQRDLINHMISDTNLVVAHGRQLGTTEAIALFVSEYLQRYCGKNVLIIAPKIAMAEELIERIREVLKTTVSINNFYRLSKHTIELYNKSYVECGHYPNLFCGKRHDITIILDSAWIEQNVLDEAKFYASIPKPKNGYENEPDKVFLFSTFNPEPETDECFQHTYLDAIKGNNEFTPLRLTWQNDPNWTRERYDNIAKCIFERMRITELDVYPLMF